MATASRQCEGMAPMPASARHYLAVRLETSEYPGASVHPIGVIFTSQEG